MNVQNIPEVVEFSPFSIPADCYRAALARGALLLLPALGTAARYYHPFAEACADRGYDVLLPELPGAGASLPRPSRRVDYGYRDLVDRYLPALVAAARSLFDAGPLIVVGHSLGAHAGMLATLQGRIAVDALVTVAGGHIHYRHWGRKGARRVRAVAWLVTSLSYLFGAVPGQQLGLGGALPRTLMREWSRIIRVGTFDHIANRLPERAAVPCLCIGYEGDFMAPSRSVAGLAHMLGGEMEWLPVDWPGNPHASWARHPDRTLDRLDHWLIARSVVQPS
jgi:predicted alpha/beta hydrolase